MKFCKDCFYYIESNNTDYAKCKHSESYDMVSGRVRYEYCNIERESMNPEKCGKDAQYFARPDEREEWQRDEPQGVTNWDTGWNGVHSCEEM